MPKTRKKAAAFRIIAERRFKVRGLSSREVVIRIGVPEQQERDSRCPFQVIGLSNDAVRYAYGVDSLQALILAFVGARRAVQNDAVSMRVLLDACVPRGLRDSLSNHDVRTAPEMGWGDLDNGDLLDAMVGQFDVLLTVEVVG